MKHAFVVITVTCIACHCIAQDTPDALDPHILSIERKESVVSWPSKPPADCPFKASGDFRGITLTGRFANYTDGDTFYLSWGADDRIYTPFTDTDAHTNPPDKRMGVLGVHVFSGSGRKAAIGHAVIAGHDPLDLKFVDAGMIPGPGHQYGGRYPCACLHYNGVWYLGTTGVTGPAWTILGPFGGFHISKDNGKTWTRSPLSTDVGKALFPEPTKFRGPVKIGYPHVVDFGKNMVHSPDGKMYLVGHGSTEQEGEDRSY